MVQTVTPAKVPDLFIVPKFYCSLTKSVSFLVEKTVFLDWAKLELGSDLFHTVSMVSSLLVFPCQQAERRPQTRAHSESYEKTRDYFSEGKYTRKHRIK